MDGPSERVTGAASVDGAGGPGAEAARDAAAPVAVAVALPVPELGLETGPGREVGGRSQHVRWWAEVGVMVAIAVLPDIAGALMAGSGSGHGHGSLNGFRQAMLLTLRSTSVCAALLYIAWRSGEGWRAFGVVRPRVWRDLGLGVLLWIGAWVVGALASSTELTLVGEIWNSASIMTRGRSDGGAGGVSWMMLLALPMNSMAEELALWGFLSTRLERLGWSAAAAVVTVSTVFASYHVYQRSSAVAAIFATGLVHGTGFRISRSLWPLVVSHTLQNIVAVAYWR